MHIDKKGDFSPLEAILKYEKGQYLAYAIMTIVFTLSLVR
ncbi:hypothetical protein SAMN04488508_103335 [Aquimarina spongiae]|uniref:Uncharacterized protein n=1 Tax=Aquimarina spongiae TaxID=570521 RepID=A0A1M6EC03_9FLAO|nr:hypothetical protein SAMN04488508_103335 [Aquimarina spongiae]